MQQLLKEINTPKEAEARAYEALRGLLEKIPILQVEGIEAEAAAGDWTPDFITRLPVDGRSHLLICEYKSNGQLRHARSSILELRNYVARRAPQATPVFIARVVMDVLDTIFSRGHSLRQATRKGVYSFE